MSKYSVLWVASESTPRDYKDRQLFANEQKADFYCEFHFNASQYDKPDSSADNPCSVIVCDNASAKSKDIAGKLSKLTSEEWGFPNRGVDIVGTERAGYWNLYYTKMPAVLTELLYGSDPAQAEILKSPEGRSTLARIHVQAIKEFFPNGGKLAFSIGHKFKVSAPGDRGAPVYDSPDLFEADYAEMVAKEVARLLETDSGCSELVAKLETQLAEAQALLEQLKGTCCK